MNKRKVQVLSILVVMLVLIITFIVNVSAAPNVDVKYDIQSDWGNGSVVNVTINNQDSSEIDGWTLDWTFGGNQKIDQMWGASYTQNGKNVTVKNIGWNTKIAAKSSISFGFMINYSGSNSKPASFKVNSKSVEPVKTKEPAKTEEPVKTKEPVKTEEPVKTKEPIKTNEPVKTPSDSSKLRVMMSSDIGGTDNDDQQSMAHFLVYAYKWDIKGLISSPWGNGRASNILDAVDAYEKDYKNLSTYADYPTPDYLRSVTKQGATDKASSKGYGSPTVASEWIAKVANEDDSRPLWITVWGGIEDVAQALHDHPEIESKLRVYWIAGPNRRNSPNASKYIANNHKNLWIIEADETYRGFFNGGDQSGDLSNKNFPEQHVQGHGALGDYFMKHRKDIKMGDTPAVLYTLDNELRNPGDPPKAGWGGAFIPYGSSRPNCWVDNPAKSSNGYDGAATVNIHREDFLRDFQKHMDRAQKPK